MDAAHLIISKMAIAEQGNLFMEQILVLFPGTSDLSWAITKEKDAV